jgi:hypothetical protein
MFFVTNATTKICCETQVSVVENNAYCGTLLWNHRIYNVEREKSQAL